MKELTQDQRDQLLGHSGSVNLVQFVALKDDDDYSYPSSVKTIVEEAGGSQSLVLDITMALSGIDKDSKFTMLTADVFPDMKSLLTALDKLKTVETVDTMALILQPDANFGLVKVLRFLAPILNLVFHINQEGEFHSQLQLEQAHINAPPAKLDTFRTFDQSEAFWNINLNKFKPPPEGMTIQEHYAPFIKETAAVTGPRVISIGAYPAMTGSVLQILEGNMVTDLNDEWHSFQLVCYPSRQSYLNLITNMPHEIIEKRLDAYERCIQMPCVASKKATE